MKIALCFSGQFRFVEETYKFINENLIKPNGIKKVFFHGWRTPFNKPYKYGGTGKWKDQRIPTSAHQTAISIYHPTKYKIEDEKSFKNKNIDLQKSIEKYFYGVLEKPQLEPDFRNRQINNMYSMWYSIQQSHLLCQEWCLENDEKFDCVIRCRFDNEIKSTISIDKYDLSKLHYMHMGQPDNMISDWLNFSNMETMGIYSSIFNVFDLLVERMIKRTGVICNELLIKEILDIYNIPRQKNNWKITLPRF